MLFTLPAALTLGLFTHTKFQQKNIVGLLPYGIAGAVDALIFTFVLASLFGALEMSIQSAFAALVILLPFAPVVGALTALFAWLIRRPDLDGRSPDASERGEAEVRGP